MLQQHALGVHCLVQQRPIAKCRDRETVPTAVRSSAGAGRQDGVVNGSAAGRIAALQEQARRPCLPHRASRLQPVVQAVAQPAGACVPGRGCSLWGRRALVARDRTIQPEDAVLARRVLAPGDAVPGVFRAISAPLAGLGCP